MDSPFWRREEGGKWSSGILCASGVYQRFKVFQGTNLRWGGEKATRIHGNSSLEKSGIPPWNTKEVGSRTENKGKWKPEKEKEGKGWEIRLIRRDALIGDPSSQGSKKQT